MINKKYELITLFVILFASYVNIRGFSEDTLYILILIVLFSKVTSLPLITVALQEYRLVNLRKLTNSIRKQQNTLIKAAPSADIDQKYFKSEFNPIYLTNLAVISVNNDKCLEHTLL